MFSAFEIPEPLIEVSEYKILRSNAGYYIGRTYYDEEIGFDLPYDRVGPYHKTREEAEKVLPLFL